MHLTQHTDYALRVLVHLASHEGELVSTADIASAYGISNHHLVKVVHRLSTTGFLAVKRGRGGGIALGRPANEIRIGDVVRACEPHLHVVECFDMARQGCAIVRVCALRGALGAAVAAFLAVLDDWTLAEVVPAARRGSYRELLTGAAAVSRTAAP
jgi:Rrf2 family transcriptional regulator, nitric oxide-sensitive transcriptional repressor